MSYKETRISKYARPCEPSINDYKDRFRFSPLASRRRRMRRRGFGELRGLRRQDRGPVPDAGGLEQLARAVRHVLRVRSPADQVMLLPAQRSVLQERLRPVSRTTLRNEGLRGNGFRTEDVTITSGLESSIHTLIVFFNSTLPPLHIRFNYGFLVTNSRLETYGTLLTDAIKTVKNVKHKLNTNKCSKGITIYKQFGQVIEKKLGFITLSKILKIMLGEEITIDNLLKEFLLFDLIYFKYTPISSVDMEQSFSIHKNLFTLEKLFKSLIVNCNI